MIALIDTCIIIDALQSREPFAGPARDIFMLAANEVFTGCITAKSVSDIYYLTHKATHSDMESRKILSKLFLLFSIVDSKGEDCLSALPSLVKDYEDAIMSETARRIGADCIVTRNIRDYETCGVVIYSPEDFVKVLS